MTEEENKTKIKIQLICNVHWIHFLNSIRNFRTQFKDPKVNLSNLFNQNICFTVSFRNYKIKGKTPKQLLWKIRKIPISPSILFLLLKKNSHFKKSFFLRFFCILDLFMIVIELKWWLISIVDILNCINLPRMCLNVVLSLIQNYSKMYIHHRWFGIFCHRIRMKLPLILSIWYKDLAHRSNEY